MPSQIASLVVMADATVLVRGIAGDSGMHAHRALQLFWSIDGPIDLELDGEAFTTRWAVIPPMRTHRLRGSGQRLAHLFLDPGPIAFRRWSRSHEARQPDAALSDRLATWCGEGCDRETAAVLAADWLRASLPGLGYARCQDERIARAIDHVDAEPAEPGWNHRSLAALAHLSPSRFQALFRAHTGQSVQQYVLWRRLLLALDLLTRGHSVTHTAVETGFADAAHLSRSFRKIVGAAPSEIRPLA